MMGNIHCSAIKRRSEEAPHPLRSLLTSASQQLVELRRAVYDGDVERLMHAHLKAVADDVEVDINNRQKHKCFSAPLVADTVVARFWGETALTAAVRLRHYHLVPVLIHLQMQQCHCRRHEGTVHSTGNDGGPVVLKADPAVRLLLKRVLLDVVDGDEFSSDEESSGYVDGTGTIVMGLTSLKRHGCGDDLDLQAAAKAARKSCTSDCLNSDRPAVVLSSAVFDSENGSIFFSQQLLAQISCSPDEECLRFLLRLTPMIDCRSAVNEGLNFAGDTAVTMAVRRRKYSLTQDLIAAGCDVTKLNYRQQSALDYLVEALFPTKFATEVNNNHIRYRDADECPVNRLRPEPQDGVVNDWSRSRLPVAMLILLESGAATSSSCLSWFILHCVHDAYIVRQLIVNVASDVNFHSLRRVLTERNVSRAALRSVAQRLSHLEHLARLLLQISIKFDQPENAVLLLRRLPLDLSTTAFWMPQKTADDAYRFLPGDCLVTWSLISQLRQTGRLGLFADRVLDALPFPLQSGVYVLLSGANRPDVIFKLVNELLRIVRVDDNFETGKAIEMFYPYACMARLEGGRHSLFRLLASTGPLLPATIINILAKRFDLNPAHYWSHVQRPQRLSSLCRRCIRFNLRWNVYYAVETLPLPSAVKEYIIRIGDD